MEIIIIILLVVVMLGMGVLLYALLSKLNSLQQKSSVDLLETDVVELGRTINQLSQTMNDKLERSSTNMQTSVQRQLSESAKLVADDAAADETDETNRRVVDVATELKTLQNVLSNPKQRGVFGEFYLESVLENAFCQPSSTRCNMASKTAW